MQPDSKLGNYQQVCPQQQSQALFCTPTYLAIPVGDALWDCRCSFFFLNFFFFFFPPLLSGPYLWNRYSQRLQIECAAWSCGLILHCCLPSNSLRYFIYLFFFSAMICLGHISGTVTHRDSKLSVLLGPAVLFCTVTYHPIRFVIIFFFFSPATILYGPYLWNRYSQRLQIECAAWSCGLIVHYCLPSNSLCYFFFFVFPPRCCAGHISGTVTSRDSKLSVLLSPAV